VFVVGVGGEDLAGELVLELVDDLLGRHGNEYRRGPRVMPVSGGHM
jgi:hypothetical protein